MPPILIDGKPHRIRRGKLVEIPEQWLGNITTEKTIRDRKTSRTVKKSAKGRKLAIKEVIPDATEWDEE